jgi:TM2 domain-containing membrane protein YozV
MDAFPRQEQSMTAATWDSSAGVWSARESKIPDSFGHSQARKDRRYVKYVPVGYADTHSIVVGYIFWVFGFTGAHRFYYGKTLTGILWFFTFGLLGVGWLIDLFLIPAMDREADLRYAPGPVDYSIAWLLLVFGGVFGLHRFVQGKWISGAVYLLTMGLFGLGIVYDVLTLNEQIHELNRHSGYMFEAG